MLHRFVSEMFLPFRRLFIGCCIRSSIEGQSLRGLFQHVSVFAGEFDLV